eukprot:jgi/Orpsp1_1/1183328/evm.model.c7180000084724.1
MKYFNLFYCFVMICVLQWSSISSMVNAKAVVDDESNEIKIRFPIKRNYVYFKNYGRMFMVSEGIDEFDKLDTQVSLIDYCHYNYSKKFVKCTFGGFRK